jgi:hypothetical protein
MEPFRELPIGIGSICMIIGNSDMIGMVVTVVKKYESGHANETYWIIANFNRAVNQKYLMKIGNEK